jgi:uracil-DNA glycosylase
MKKLIHPSWEFLLEIPQWKENFKTLKEHRRFAHPYPQVVLNPFKHSLEEVKVVIIQEFPYPKNVSNGYAYGVQSALQVDAQYLYSELFVDYQESLPFDPAALETQFTHFWNEKLASQGVLLLVKNIAILEKGNKQLVWDKVFDKILQVLYSKKHLAWLLWGRNLWDITQNIPDHHFIIKSARPGNIRAKSSFLGSRPFTRTNTYLKENNLTPIEWVIVNHL